MLAANVSIALGSLRVAASMLTAIQIAVAEAASMLAATKLQSMMTPRIHGALTLVIQASRGTEGGGGPADVLPLALAATPRAGGGLVALAAAGPEVEAHPAPEALVGLLGAPPARP